MVLYVLLDANGAFHGVYSSREQAESAAARFERNLFAQVLHAQPYSVRAVQVDP